MINDQQSNQIMQNQANDLASNGSSDPAATPAPNLGLGTNPAVMQPAYPTDLDNSQPAPDPAPVVDNNDAYNSAPVVPEPVQSAPGDLDEIKKQALEQLSPMVSKLEQAPEERYKTLMMMIQASDNQDLIKEAYEAAKQIEDEKVKAEALLSIVNEINYFTQKSS